ncbi:fasciclin-like arabinogalactan protein 11 [Phalaenopsis equestris]|uniref:fasciclin-like arabinogalactan protein 11 n=1 Tax=Phalaenopsis equestris TaxID=78828 RepID=UPI0009E5D8C1|nr:fasciclin-like arabinogalactan protein 11 [Phalaenopsis equestris]
MASSPIFTIPFFLLLLLIPTTKTLAQTSSAPAPAGPLNITAVLEKAGQYNTLIRLMKSTQIADQINNQLNNSNSGITIFAPTDNAFTNLPAGTLNSLTDQQKVSLIQFHVVPSLITMSQFQTVSNPLRTQAGNTDNGEFPLNVTSSGNQVNISTGVVNTTVSNALYTDSKLAVYQVDKVLLPLAIFGSEAPAEAPGPEPSTPRKKKKKEAAADEPTASPAKEDAGASSGFRLSWGWRGKWAGFVVVGSLFCLHL